MSGSIPEKTEKHWNCLHTIKILQVADTPLELTFLRNDKTLLGSGFFLNSEFTHSVTYENKKTFTSYRARIRAYKFQLVRQNTFIQMTSHKTTRK